MKLGDRLSTRSWFETFKKGRTHAVPSSQRVLQDIEIVYRRYGEVNSQSDAERYCYDNIDVLLNESPTPPAPIHQAILKAALVYLTFPVSCACPTKRESRHSDSKQHDRHNWQSLHKSCVQSDGTTVSGGCVARRIGF